MSLPAKYFTKIHKALKTPSLACIPVAYASFMPPIAFNKVLIATIVAVLVSKQKMLAMRLAKPTTAKRPYMRGHGLIFANLTRAYRCKPEVTPTTTTSTTTIADEDVIGDNVDDNNSGDDNHGTDETDENITGS